MAVHCPVPFLAFDAVQPFRGFSSEAGLTIRSQAFGHITFTCCASVSLLIKCEGGRRRSFTFLPAPTHWFCEPFKARVYHRGPNGKRWPVLSLRVVFLEQAGMVHVLSSTDRAAAERQSEEEQGLVLTAQGINSESSVSNCARLAFAE